MSDSSFSTSRPCRLNDVPRWDLQTDVVVVGFGASGACAAIEAADAGAKVTLLELAAGSGGASALSGGDIYMGGGTEIQKSAGYEDTAEEIIDLIRQLDFSLSGCKYLVCTHADVDHVQGMHRAKELVPHATILGHPECQRLLAAGDRIVTYAEISAQGISIDLPTIVVEKAINEGDVIELGSLKIDVWNTPGHTPSQLSFRLGKLLFSGDNIYRDGCVGVIDAHHGSNIEHFVKSLRRIRASDVEWLLPSHGPIFRKDNALLDRTMPAVYAAPLFFHYLNYLT